MTYDKTLPTNTTKIRNYPTVLTDNFAALEEGDISLKHWQVNFIERNAVPGPISNDPTRADNTMILYSKQDGAGETELFVIDDRNPANVTQLTEEGALGSTSTQVNANGVAFDVDATTGLTYVDGQFIVAYAHYNSSGVFQYGKNMATSGTPHPATGKYNVDVNADVLQNGNYVVVGNVRGTTLSSGNSARALNVPSAPAPVASTPTTIGIETRREGGLTNHGFFIMICGGR